jgi:hypothetical protein
MIVEDFFAITYAATREENRPWKATAPQIPVSSRGTAALPSCERCMPAQIMRGLSEALFACRLSRPANRFVLFAIFKISLDPIYVTVFDLEHVEIGPDVVK